LAVERNGVAEFIRTFLVNSGWWLALRR